MQGDPPGRARSYSVSVFAAVVAIGGHAGLLVAQGTPIQVIEDCRRPCAGIVFERIGRIGGDPRDPVLMNWRASPTPLAGGGWVATSTSEPGTIAFYDSEGRFQRSIGRLGSGPGEFRERAYSFAGPGPDVWVVDPGNQRATVLGPSGEVLREFPLTGYVAAIAPAGDGSAVVVGALMVQGKTLPGRFHILDSEGNVLESLAAEAIARQAYGISVSPSGTLLGSHVDSYAVQEWSADGQLMRVLTRELPWFRKGDGRQPFPPQLMQAPADPAGRLWAILKRPVRRSPMDAIRSFGDVSALSTGVIEVIDPGMGRVVAQGLHDHPYLFPLLPFRGVFVTPAEDEHGYVSFLVLRAKVTDP